MWKYNYTDELYHHGVKGMKWGVRRRKYGTHIGPRKMLTKKRQLAADKKDLEAINKGEHLSIGLTKKRQAAYDARDKRILTNRIAKNEAALKRKEKPMSDDARKAKNLRKKKLDEMTNQELRDLNNRMNLEQQYKKLNAGKIAKGVAIVGTTAAVLGSINGIRTNGGQLLTAGKSALEKVLKK